MRLRLLTLAVALLLIGGGALWMSKLGPHPRQSAGLPSREAATSGTVSAEGVVEPASGIIRLSFAIPGKIRSLAVEDGEPVRRGQIVAELSVDDLDARIAVAEQELSAREKNLSGLSPAQTEARQRALTDMSQARLRLIDAQQAAEKAVLRSPINGVVLSTNVRPGEWTSPECRTPIVTVGNLDRLQVWAAVAEGDVAKVAVGQKALCRCEAYGPRPFPARVTYVGRSIVRTPLGATEQTGAPAGRGLPIRLALEGNPKLPVGLPLHISLQALPPAGATDQGKEP